REKAKGERMTRSIPGLLQQCLGLLWVIGIRLHEAVVALHAWRQHADTRLAVAEKAQLEDLLPVDTVAGYGLAHAEIVKRFAGHINPQVPDVVHGSSHDLHPRRSLQHTYHLQGDPGGEGEFPGTYGSHPRRGVLHRLEHDAVEIGQPWLE